MDPRRRSIFHDTGHYHGFLHRLDVPSSGLVLLAASVFAAFNVAIFSVRLSV